MNGVGSPSQVSGPISAMTSALLSGTKVNARPWMAGPDRSEAGAEASRSDPYIIRVRSREGERGRSIRGPVYAAKARCKEYLRKGKDKTGPTRAADDGPIKART